MTRFEWDERKNRANIQKHGISFELAKEVFLDPFSVTMRDVIVDCEERLWTIGRLESLLIVVVVHTTTENEEVEIIRMISARNATPHERRLYEEENEQ